ncbi:hypothetical protein QQ045_018522 [Rhodiola kirilowii]
MGRPNPIITTGLVVVPTTPPFGRGVEYEILEPTRTGHRAIPGGLQDVESCLPKGPMRHSSAPSRYRNAQTLGSTSSHAIIWYLNDCIEYSVS